MILTDLRELKKVLEIPEEDTSEDLKLSFIIELVSNWIEEVINRPGLTFRSRTQYYKGSGTSKLLLRSRPVFTEPTIQVWVDEAGNFGSRSGSFDSTTSLTYGEHFCLQIDQDDEISSRSGILLRIGDVWPKPPVRQRGYLTPFIGDGRGEVKVTYSAGYTVDTLPSVFRLATNLLVARLRYVLPLGMELNAESYEERNISLATEQKDYLLAMVRPMLMQFKNWIF